MARSGGSEPHDPPLAPTGNEPFESDEPWAAVDAFGQDTATAGVQSMGARFPEPHAAARTTRMPTLLQTEGFRFFFYSNKRREPSHVHVEPTLTD
jgi:hypothetical protein